MDHAENSVAVIIDHYLVLVVDTTHAREREKFLNIGREKEGYKLIWVKYLKNCSYALS